MPQVMTSAAPAVSAVRNMDPTLYTLRTLSKTKVRGEGPSPFDALSSLSSRAASELRIQSASIACLCLYNIMTCSATRLASMLITPVLDDTAPSLGDLSRKRRRLARGLMKEVRHLRTCVPSYSIEVRISSTSSPSFCSSSLTADLRAAERASPFLGVPTTCSAPTVGLSNPDPIRAIDAEGVGLRLRSREGLLPPDEIDLLIPVGVASRRCSRLRTRSPMILTVSSQSPMPLAQTRPRTILPPSMTRNSSSASPSATPTFMSGWSCWAPPPSSVPPDVSFVSLREEKALWRAARNSKLTPPVHPPSIFGSDPGG
mmetsp:Transcript_34974/g.81966  ORF Transcript_34974/g.81966 Transcript_34974/m.81966 type:complete len:315 (-) Transcript_34974:481-1425(-)